MGRSARSVVVELEGLGARFAAWRRGRRRGARIPQSLWDAAAEVAQIHGVSATASHVRICYYSLKKRMEQRKRQSSAPFVELPALPLTVGQGECVVEWEWRDGRRCRVHWRGPAVPTVAAVAQAFQEFDECCK